MASDRWSWLEIKRFYGLDLKTNVVDVRDGVSIGLLNVFQNRDGVVSKRSGNEIMFASDESSSTPIDEMGSCTLSGTKYYFKFVDGKFRYSTSLTGSVTTISPSPAISTSNQIWWEVLDGKLFFVDGTNALRYFNGSAISASSIYQRPTAALTSASGAGGFTYLYTVDNGLGESPAVSTLLTTIVSAATVAVPKNTGPQTLVAGDVVRIYSRADTIAAASKLVATHTVTAPDLGGATFNVATVAIADDQVQLYSELGVALNKSAPTALVGLTKHYGRLVGWFSDYVQCSKSSNPHSWPDDSAQHEAFKYGFSIGDSEGIQACVSFRESMFVLKKTQAAVFAGIGPDDTGNGAFAFRRLETNGHGCSAPKSAIVIGEERTLYLVYRSQMGFYATNGSDPVRIGEEIEPASQALALSSQFSAVAVHDRRNGLYICFEGGASSKIAWVLDVREDNKQRVGWFKWTGPNVTAIHWDGDRLIYGTSTGFCASERIAGTSLDFADAAVEYVDASAVNASTNVITVARSYQTGDLVTPRTTGTIPTGLTANTVYYAIRVSATQIKLASSLANAQAGTEVDITAAGSGTHSLVAQDAISAFYTTNWLKFKSALKVKKLTKLGLVFNAVASSVSLAVESAYDWVEVFTDAQAVGIGSAHLWGDSSWASFVWGTGAVASPRNVAIARRKVRAIRYRFTNNALNQDFNLQGLEQGYEMLRNRGDFAA